MNKRVLIVGGNTGIGKTLNKLLLADGHETHLISRSQGSVDVLDEEPNFPSIEALVLEQDFNITLLRVYLSDSI